MLRIHDILGWIRIWIRGSMPLTNGSGFGSGCGSGSFYFRHWPSRGQQKINLKKSFLHITFLNSTFTSFFTGKKSKRGHKTVEIKVFLIILLNDRRIRIRSRGSIPLTNGSGSGRPKNTWIRIRIRIRSTGLNILFINRCVYTVAPVRQ